MAPAKKRAKIEKAPETPSPVDIFIPGSDDYEIITTKGLPAYSAMLNQTNLANNNNKFFLIQALARKDGSGFASWFRWGRVGYSGQTNLQVVGSREEAIGIFDEKFQAKTSHTWGAKIHQSFKSVPGKYTLLAVESITEKIEDVPGKPLEMIEVKYKPTELPQEIFNLIKLITARETFERELQIAGIDLNRMPLGKISAPMIKQAYRILNELEKELLGAHRKAMLFEYSNQFFTLIPHNFGFSKGIHYVIDSFAALREKTDLLESLQQAKDNTSDTPEIKREEILRANPIDENFSKLNKQLTPIPKDSPEFDLIVQYKELTQGATHSTRSSIRNVFRIDHVHPEKPKPRKKKAGKITAKAISDAPHLLWHGSRLTNWFSILMNGLKIAPPEAPHTGYMFDKGIYTTDCFSKCAQYCFNSPGERGLVVLCEVDLGKTLELKQADYDASKKLGNEYSSVKGVGNWFPNPKEHVKLDDGTIVPLGKLMEAKSEVDGENLPKAKGRTS